MKKFENLIILVMVCAGAVMLYQKLDSMGPEFESELRPPSQTEAVATETKPAAPETSAQMAPATPAPAAAETSPTTQMAATTPAAPAAPAPSAEPAVKPAAQPATPAAPVAEQPAAPAATAKPTTTAAAPATPVAEQPPAPVTPAQPATPTPAVGVTPPPPVPAAPAKPVVLAPVIPAPASAIPAPASAISTPAAAVRPAQPAAQPPVQVATALPPPAPAPAAPQEPQKKLMEMTQDDLLARLPATAKYPYRTAHSVAESKGDMMGMRSWFSQWRRYLVDPARALLELDMAKLLVQGKGDYHSESLAKAAKRANLNEAKMLISGIRFRRINNAELSEMLVKVEQDVDRELGQLK